MSQSLNKERGLPLRDSKSSSLEIRNTSECGINNNSKTGLVTPTCPIPEGQDRPHLPLPQGLSALQGPIGVHQIVSNFSKQDHPIKTSWLLPVCMPQHPIQHPYLLAGTSIKQEPLDLTKENLEHIPHKPHLASPLRVKPILPKIDKKEDSNHAVDVGRPTNLMLEGRNLSTETRDLIFSAITIMKNRKARPDAKRISSWINRRYGRNVYDIRDELDRLVKTGDLTRVDYKGNPSFRINYTAVKPRQKRKSPKVGLHNQTRLGGDPLPGPDGNPAQLSLYLLVMELLGEPSNLNSKIPVSRQAIAAAVKSSSRDFVRASVLQNLDFLLEHEVKNGNFVKVDAENYFVVPKTTLKPSTIKIPLPVQGSFPQLPQYPISPSAISQSNPTLSLPTSPLPPHQVVPMSMSPVPFQMTYSRPTYSLPPSGLQFQQVNMNQLHCATTTQNVQQLLVQNCSFPLPIMSIPPNQLPTSSLSGGATLNPGLSQMVHQKQSFHIPQFMTQHNFEAKDFEKSDDQIKNDLIRFQLSKISNKDQKIRSPGKKFPDTFMELLEAPLLQDNLEKLRSFRGKTNNLSMSYTNANGFGSRIAQHSTSQFTNLNQNGHLNTIDRILPVSFFIPERTQPPNVELKIPDSWAFKNCFICKGGQDISSQRISDAMLTCKICSIKSHSSCLKLSEELTCRILSQQSWLCNTCRHCVVCSLALIAGYAINCKNCDFRIHLHCLPYPLFTSPSGEWECQTCISARLLQTKQPQLTVSVVTNGHYRDQEFLQQKTPTPKCQSQSDKLSFPHERILAKWDEFEADKSVPDISDWSPKQLSNFFEEKGFPPEVYTKFVELEVDGCTVLIMRRQDVLDGMGLKLGKAIHIFSYVKKFQLAQASR